jgi:murein DD-endopeptidase MepM/ murein hydrolase activator NlpD
MQSRARDLQGFAVLLIALLAGGFILARNVRPAQNYDISGPTSTATKGEASWQEVIQSELVNGASPVPTRNIPVATFAAPTLPPIEGTPILLQPGQVAFNATPTATRPVPVGATRAAPTAGPSPTPNVVVVPRNDPKVVGQFAPPPEQVPLSIDPRDHFWFKRPVDSSANSRSLQYYPYGSDGPRNEWRVHHGLDMPNPVGQEVRAAATGKVIWASDNYRWIENGRVTDAAYTYGNVVIIQHDFGYAGKPIFTLYAHLSVIIAQVGQQVNTGDILGLSGQSGVVSGPHVHFEVRVAENNYYYTRNPILWMAPYLDHGVITGRIDYRDGSAAQDITVSLLQQGVLVDTTTTYVNVKRDFMRKWDVTSDDIWGENFVFGDVPVGDYQVVVNVGGIRISKDISVRAATTAFIDMGQAPIGPNSANDSPTLAP